MESKWKAASFPSYEYLELNGEVTQPPKMTYKEDLKIRSEFWANIFDHFHNESKSLSEKPPKNGAEAALLSLNRKEEL